MEINKLEALERIAELRRQGVLDEEEFQSAKQRILLGEAHKTEEVDETPFSDKPIEETESFDLLSRFKERRGKNSERTLDSDEPKKQKKSFAKKLLPLLAVAGVAVGVALAVTTSSENADRKYDKEIQENFLFSCQTAGGVHLEDCQELLTCIEGEIPQKEYIKNEALIFLKGEVPDDLADVMSECTAELIASQNVVEENAVSELGRVLDPGPVPETIFLDTQLGKDGKSYEVFFEFLDGDSVPLISAGGAYVELTFSDLQGKELYSDNYEFKSQDYKKTGLNPFSGGVPGLYVNIPVSDIKNSDTGNAGKLKWVVHFADPAIYWDHEREVGGLPGVVPEGVFSSVISEYYDSWGSLNVFQCWKNESQLTVWPRISFTFRDANNVFLESGEVDLQPVKSGELICADSGAYTGWLDGDIDFKKSKISITSNEMSSFGEAALKVEEVSISISAPLTHFQEFEFLDLYAIKQKVPSQCLSPMDKDQAVNTINRNGGNFPDDLSATALVGPCFLFFNPPTTFSAGDVTLEVLLRNESDESIKSDYLNAYWWGGLDPYNTDLAILEDAFLECDCETIPSGEVVRYSTNLGGWSHAFDSGDFELYDSEVVMMSDWDFTSGIMEQLARGLEMKIKPRSYAKLFFALPVDSPPFILEQKYSKNIKGP